MLRFLQQLEIGNGDYTQERYQSSEPTLEELRQFTMERSSDSTQKE
ncbi:hypothetical protein [Phormidesmis priestleyi]|nr:hypothetical protein [Phormidesmis priestleyi]